MKKIFVLIISCLFVINALSQSSSQVKQAIKSKNYVQAVEYLAKRMNKKMKKGDVSNFVQYYPMAIEQIEAAPQTFQIKEFGYEMAIDEVEGWIAMYKQLKGLPADITDKKGASVSIQVKEYVSYLNEVTQKAVKVRFDAAKEIFDGNGSAKDKLEVVTHLEAISRRVPNADYTQMKEMAAEVNYQYGKELLSGGADFAAKRKGISYFRNAQAFVKNYKDIAVLAADFYYQEAQKKEREESFAAQDKAVHYYTRAIEWKSHYKDAKERIAIVKVRSKVNVILVGADGKALKNSDLVGGGEGYNSLKRAIKEPFILLSPDDIEINFNQTADAQKLASRNGRYVFCKLRVAENEVKYDINKESSTENIEVYFKKGKNADGKPYSKKVDKATYKLYNFAKGQGSEPKDYIITKHEGTLKKTVEKVTLSLPYYIDVYDTKGGVEKLGSLNRSTNYYDQRTIETYEGDAEAKPKVITNQSDRKLKTQQEMLVNYKKPQMKSFIKGLKGLNDIYASKLYDVLKSNVKYE